MTAKKSSKGTKPAKPAKKAAPAKKHAAKPAPVATLPSTAELKTHTGASKVKSPVAAVWELCEAMPNAKRREVVAAAVAQRVNFHTARTQYQAWLTAKRAEGKA